MRRKRQAKKSNSKKNQKQDEESHEEDINDENQENNEQPNNENEKIEADSKPTFDIDKVVKIVTVNAGSLPAACKKGFMDYVKYEDADIICVQETKLHSKSPTGFDNYIIDGYYGYFFNSEQKKGYSGTCIYTKIQPISIKPGFNDSEGRIILIEYSNFYLINTYVPNAGMKLERLDYKINTWNPKLKNLMDELCKKKTTILCGDLNVAHQPIDIFDTKGKEKCAGYTPEERKWFDDFLKSGYTDIFRHLYPKKQQFSFFSYRFNMKAKNHGWRLDYFVMPTNTIDNDSIVDCLILNTNFSDHSPCVLILNKDKVLSEGDVPVKEPGITVLNSGAIFKKPNEESEKKDEDPKKKDEESEKKDEEPEKKEDINNDDDDQESEQVQRSSKATKKGQAKKTNKKKK